MPFLRTLARLAPCLGHCILAVRHLIVVWALLLATAPMAHAGVDTRLSGDDSAAGPFPIGFTFNFYGKPQTQFFASTNGLLQFGGGSSSYSNGCLPSQNNTIYVFWDDLRTNVSGQPDGKIKYETIGEAPNRRLVVQWTNQYFYSSNLPMGTFQVVLHEGTNEIKMQYRFLNGTAGSGSSATIGIQGVNPQFLQHGCNRSGAVRAEQALSYMPDAAGTSYQLNTEAPYEFLDISGLTPEPPEVAAPHVKNGPAWTWGKLIELNTYEVEIQTADGQKLSSTVVGNVNTFTLQNAEHGKSYRARVRGSINGGATWELWSGLSQPITVDQVAPSGQLGNATQTSSNHIQFRYTLGDEHSGVASARLEIASDPAFSTIVHTAALAVNGSSHVYGDAAPGQHLYARISVTDRAGNVSPPSNVAEIVMLAPPVAGFTPSASTGEAPLSLTFQNTTTGPATAYAWDFGDGRSSTLASPAIRYEEPGSYTVSLRATGIAGFTSASTTIVVNPDRTVPVFTAPTIDGVEAGPALTLTQSRQLAFSVSDANTVTGVSATLSGAALGVTALGAGGYRIALDPLAHPNGSYALVISATDRVGNVATQTLEVTINVPPPPAPVLSAPNAARTTNQAALTVAGSAAGETVQVLVNGQPAGAPLSVANGRFSTEITLAEGVNRISATTSNARGASAASAEIAITLDTSRPAAPSALAALAQPQGKIRLNFTPSADPASRGTIILRAAQPFSTAEQATRLNATPFTGNVYEDLPPADGVYHYRLASINALGTLSLLSNSVDAAADSTAPKAVSIVYSPQGKTDPASGRVGQGNVNLVLSVSEALQSAPFLSIVPQGGVPITVNLASTGALTYSGSFAIGPNTPSGVANALFSARDAVGNRGTDIDAGATLNIDTEGPVLTSIAIVPGSPIRNDSGQTVQATFTFSKAQAGTPQIKYLLSGQVRTPVVINGLSAQSATSYQGSFVLPADAGLGSPESLSFSHQSRDDLDNVSTSVTAANRFQVYQGSLPPADVPYGFTARAQPGGKVALSWQAVELATAYQVYRQAPGETALKPLARTGGVSYLDQTTADGVHRYAVASVRVSNGQESVSSMSNVIEVGASTTAPGAPQNLVLSLGGQGILAAWQAPLSSQVDYYNLYRAGGTRITSIAGLTPIKTRIRTTQVVDTSPSPSEGAYVVTAVDAAGNESAISNSAYLNASLLPVRQLKVVQSGSNLPVVSWTAPNGNVAGYLVYLGAESNKIRLTADTISATSFTDTGFSSGERRYTIATVDANGMEQPRSIVLPNVAGQIVAGLPIKRGIFNKLQVQVANLSSSALSGVRVAVRLPIDRDAASFKDHVSEIITLAANETRLVPVIVGGYADLPGTAQAEVKVDIAAGGDELVTIARSQTVDVTEGALVVGMATEEFTRGASGKLKLTIENTSEVEVELLTATGNGAGESSELRFKLLDGDGNVLASQPYKQVFGASVITLPNGQTVARIPAGTSYVSEVFSVNVPGAAPSAIRVRLEVDKLRYHSGREDEVVIAGRGSEKTVSLIDTAYVGEVTDAAPLASFGDRDIVITGRALERGGSQALPNTRLKLVFNQQGFERVFEVLTDSSGSFSYTFKPTLSDSGVYKLSAVHPDMTDRPEQRTFVINRVTVGPTPYKLDLPKNLAFTVPFSAKAGPGTAATNLRLTLDPASQPTGQIPAGVTVQLPAPVSLSERQSLNLPVQFIAGDAAQTSGSLIFNVVSDESGGAPIGQARINYTLSEARPHLVSTPNFVETGLAQGATQMESLTVKNSGLQDAANLQFTLVKTDGSAAPSWASIASQANGTLAVGASRAIDLRFAPPAGTAEGVYEFKLKVAGDNVAEQTMDVFASVTQSGQGNVLFKAANIFTATIGKDGKLIPGLAGASVTLQNEDVATVSQQLSTDALGEALFENLPAGRYQFRAKAPNHQETGGRLVIKPGITATQPVFLKYNTVTVEWSVREVTIQDRYDITINATYETDVPAAVVVVQPASINLPKMAVGDVYYGELTLTNYGLIRADKLVQTLPNSDAFFRYEFLAEVPTALEAKQRVTIPYRVVALQSLEAAAGAANASGGGCYNYSNRTRFDCEFVCANGAISLCGALAGFFSGSASSCSSGGGAGGFWGGFGGGFGGGSSTPIKTKNKKCVGVPRGGSNCD